VLAATVVVLAAGIGYYAFGRGHSSPTSNPTSTSNGGHAKHGASMLAAGKVGQLGDVPWSLVGAGWTLAQFSSAQPAPSGQASGGLTTTYLVDPLGGRYEIHQWPAGVSQTLIAWSGNGKSALFGADGAYSVLTVTSGEVTTLNVPAGVSVAGFTRPDGLNILAVDQASSKYKLQRYDLTGAFQQTLSAMGHRHNQASWQGSCQFPYCGAVSSPSGDLAVWGVTGDEMQVVSNAGGHVKRLRVPDSGSPPSCTPLSWWDAGTVLADCAAVSGQATQLRLWLVPIDGSPPQPLTAPSGGGAGDGVATDAWQVDGQEYITSTSSGQCSSAASGPGGLGIMKLSSGSSPAAVTLTGTTGNYSTILGAAGDRLLVLAQTSCPGTSELLWLDPSTGAEQMLLSAQSSEAGVTSAAAFGSDLGAIAG